MIVNYYYIPQTHDHVFMMQFGISLQMWCEYLLLAGYPQQKET